jgi:Spy/CpxP family protein refolding chaperone
MKLRTVLTAAVTLILFTGTMANEGGAKPENCEKKGYHQKGEKGTHLKEELNLSDEQSEELKTLKSAHKKEMKTNHQATKAVRLEIFEELRKETPNSSVTNKLSDKIGTLHSEMNKSMVTQLLEIKKILSQEQFEKLLELKGNRGKKGKGMSCPKGAGKSSKK